MTSNNNLKKSNFYWAIIAIMLFLPANNIYCFYSKQQKENFIQITSLYITDTKSYWDNVQDDSTVIYETTMRLSKNVSAYIKDFDIFYNAQKSLSIEMGDRMKALPKNEALPYLHQYVINMSKNTRNMVDEYNIVMLAIYEDIMTLSKLYKLNKSNLYGTTMRLSENVTTYIEGFDDFYNEHRSLSTEMGNLIEKLPENEVLPYLYQYVVNVINNTKDLKDIHDIIIPNITKDIVTLSKLYESKISSWIQSQDSSVNEGNLPRWTIFNKEYSERESTGLLRGIVITNTKDVIGSVSCYGNQIVVIVHDMEENTKMEYKYTLVNDTPVINFNKDGVKYEQYKAVIKDSSSKEDIDCLVHFYPTDEMFLFIFSDPHLLFVYYNE